MKHTTRYTGLKRGQIVVFIVLIFQVFFIFGAMVINIGMVVHDKINLQNSVDLAALYGAQRQAEVLDALAHINYQIRQSYKLMAWRYLVLGNVGANYRRGGSAGRQYRITDNSPQEGKQNCNFLLDTCNKGPCDQPNNGQCAYAVCIGHPFWDWNNRDHLCQHVRLGASDIPRPQSVNVSNTVLRFIGQNTIQSIVAQANRRLDRICEAMKNVNWYVASTFLSYFRYDQWKRKVLAKELFNRTLQKGNGHDIEGKSIATGIENTIKNNLTFINYRNYNSPDTIKTIQATSTGPFGDYFEWEQIAPVLFYIVTDPTHPNNTPPTSSSQDPFCWSSLFPVFHPPSGLTIGSDNLLYLSSVASESINSGTPYEIGHLSSGFYKKNNKTIYTQVVVDIPYTKQIFLPFSGNNMRLKAKAFAKPFGAVFGPPPDTDLLLPVPHRGPAPQLLSGSIATGAYNHLLYLAPNYSSYPGDSHGLFNHAVQSYWTKELRNEKVNIANYYAIDGLPQTEPTDPMVLDFESNGSLNVNFFSAKIRELEEIAIAPDAFDLMYYTILPNYMATLYRKMASHLSPLIDSSSGDTISPTIPGDLGFFNTEGFTTSSGGPPLRDFGDPTLIQSSCYKGDNIREQRFRLNFIDKQIECASTVDETYKPYLHKVKSLDHLLTSWYPITKGFYNKDGLYNVATGLQNFGKCDDVRDASIKLENSNNLVENDRSNFTINEQKLIPHHCIQGGRSGFSVKLIHESMAI